MRQTELKVITETIRSRNKMMLVEKLFEISKTVNGKLFGIEKVFRREMT